MLLEHLWILFKYGFQRLASSPALKWFLERKQKPKHFKQNVHIGLI